MLRVVSTIGHSYRNDPQYPTPIAQDEVSNTPPGITAYRIPMRDSPNGVLMKLCRAAQIALNGAYQYGNLNPHIGKVT
jgi:hypothetical protein